jgi:hypothetical protein
LAGRVTAQLGLLAALFACHNDHPTTPALPAASSVTFTLPTTHLVVGDSVLATPKVRDANGVVIDSAPIVWGSLNTGVAAVSSYGEVHGKGTGITSIIAKSGPAADTVAVTVDTKASIAVDSITPHQLIAGQSATVYGHQFSSIPTATVIKIGVDSLAPTTADSTHLVFTLPDTSCSPAGTRTVSVKSRGSVVQVIEHFAPGAGPVSLPVGGVQALNASTDGCLQFAANSSAATYVLIVANVSGTLNTPFAFQLSQILGDSLPLGFHGYARVHPKRAYKPARKAVASAASEASAAQAAVGDAVTYNVPLHGCDSAVVTHGHVMAVGTHAIIAQDDSAASGLGSSDFAAIAADVDASIYPTDTLHFGSPSDIDGNGHVILYYTPKVGKLTRGDATLVGGFFFRGDLFATSNCAASNQAEILYLSPSTPLTQTRGSIAHVLEHLINAGNHIRANAAVFEDPWLDEALAHAAEDFVGRAVDGYTDMQRLTFANVSSGPNADAYASYFQGNATRYTAWLTAPQQFGGADTTADTSAAARGAAWTLLRYAFDQYANGSPVALSRALAAGPATGVYNFVSSTGAPLDSLIEGWLVASYATGYAVPGVAPRYTFTSYNWQDVEGGLNGSFALLSSPFAAGSSGLADSTQANTGFYVTMANPAPTTAYSVRLLTPTGTVVTLSGARFYLLRTQ